MLKMSDLEAAAAEGIISRDQAARLLDFANRLAGTSDEAIEVSDDTRDEPFRLLRGFRDFFIAIGIAIFSVGITTLAVTGAGWSGTMNVWAGSNESWMFVYALGLTGTGVVLAEWITRRQRLPLSSLMTSVAFALWSALLLTTFFIMIWEPAHSKAEWAGAIVPWLMFLGAVIGTTLFYWRYRLPFALLLLAGCFAGFVYFLLSAVLHDQWTDAHARSVIGVLGVLGFAVAMWFDAKDPLRVTRFSECGFWLHLLAAPMMVHSLLFNQFDGEPNLALILGSMAVLALVALLIDRRALLVAGLSYLAVAITQVVSRSEFLDGFEFAVTASILGAAVLFLGLGWTPIRRGLINAVPLGSLKSMLPPVAAA